MWIRTRRIRSPQLLPLLQDLKLERVWGKKINEGKKYKREGTGPPFVPNFWKIMAFFNIRLVSPHSWKPIDKVIKMFQTMLKPLSF